MVKDEYDNIDREATYAEARRVAVVIATYVAGVDDEAESGFPEGVIRINATRNPEAMEKNFIVFFIKMIMFFYLQQAKA